MSNDLSTQSFDKAINDLLSAIQCLLERQYIIPSLITIYSTIDTLSWLARPKTQQDVRKSDFLYWTETYLLPDSTLECTAIDLYSARCAIVHSNTFVSNLSRSKSAKEIYYTWGVASPILVDNVIKKRGDFATTVHIDTLFESLKAAIERFKNDISKNDSLRTLVYGRASQYFFSFLYVKRAGLG